MSELESRLLEKKSAVFDILVKQEGIRNEILRLDEIKQRLLNEISSLETAIDTMSGASDG